jgi:hypothetical protein
VIADLVTTWRTRAEQLGPYAPAAAHAYNEAAAELERELAMQAAETLSLRQAAEASGYSADYLGRKVRNGAIPNVGRPHAPRIRRADLPRKAAGLRGCDRPLHLVGATPGEIARAVVTSDEGEGR